METTLLNCIYDLHMCPPWGRGCWWTSKTDVPYTISTLPIHPMITTSLEISFFTAAAVSVETSKGSPSSCVPAHLAPIIPSSIFLNQFLFQPTPTSRSFTLSLQVAATSTLPSMTRAKMRPTWPKMVLYWCNMLPHRLSMAQHRPNVASNTQHDPNFRPTWNQVALHRPNMGSRGRSGKPTWLEYDWHKWIDRQDRIG